MNIRALLLIPFLSLVACGGLDDGFPPEPDDADAIVDDADGKADSASSTYTYYSVRPDFRKCISPLCGGYYVKKVNSSTATEAYVAEMDFKGAGLDDSDRQLFSVAGSLVRGKLKSKSFGSFGVMKIFAATEVWAAGSTDATPSGTYYKLTDRNLTCVRAPCFTIAEARLNSSYRTTLSGIAGPLVDGAGAALEGDHSILVTAVNRTEFRPGYSQGGRVADVSMYWTRVVHYAGPTCATLDCGPGATCQMIDVVCIKAPCSPQPTCIPDGQ